MITSGHYLATAAGLRIMEQGGNAIDAAAAVCFCLNLLEPENNGLGGENPTLIYSAKEKKTYALSGMGWSPAAFTIDWCRQNGIDLIPGNGYLPACVPAMAGSWVLALARFGTMSFAQVVQPAIELAEDGYPMYASLQGTITGFARLFTECYPSTARIYLPDGHVPEIGEVIRNPDFARTLRTMCQAEAAAKSKGRIAGIEAAGDAFYRGEITDKILDFMTRYPVEDASGQFHTGLLTHADMAGWQPALEAPVTLNYRGLDVYKCSSWTQGPVFLQQLAILEGYDLARLGHNTVDYLHTWIECAKLAFADREAYYGDPLLDSVPFDVLLSKEYASRRRELIGATASPDLRPGDVGHGIPDYVTRSVRADNRRSLASHTGDTTHLDTVDRAGNMVASTPSGGWIQASPVIEGLGFPMGTRGQMFYLNPDRPNALAPHKRPRATLTPTLVTRAGEPFMVFGTPGGDAQDQWTLQFFLNYIDFGMNIQEALDAPTVHTDHFPSSFYPREAYPLAVSAEGRIHAEVIQDLERLGHKVTVGGDWIHGKCMGIRIDREHGILVGGASPRACVAFAIGY